MIIHQKTIKFDGVLLASAPSPPPDPPNPPNPPSKVQWSSKLLCLWPLPLRPVLVFLVFFLVFGGIRVPSKPLFIERDDHLRTLHIGLLRRYQVSFIRIFPAWKQKQIQVTVFDPGSHSDVAVPVSTVAAHTNHFMRNMSSPVESVAPIILSGASPRAKPLSFSVWGSNKIQLQSSTKYR